MSSSARRSGSKLKERSDELHVTHRVTSTQSFDLTFAYHVHGFNTFQSSFRSMKPLEALHRPPHPSQETVILLDNVRQVFCAAQAAVEG